MTHTSGLPRFFEAVAAGAGLIVLSPLFAVVALCITATSPGPVFYRARRMGIGGREFLLYKFRSMRIDADRTGSGITRAGDARVTGVGRWLRRLKLDELPQLINVWRGDMGLVGPRPEDPRFVQFYPARYTAVLDIRPGITSAASLVYRDESALLTSDDHEREYVEELLPDKLRIDLEYFSRASARTDILLILHTIRASIFG